MSVINTRTIKKLKNNNKIYSSDYTNINANSIIYPSSGGIGIFEYSIGDLIYASAPTVLSKLSPNDTNFVLISNGVGLPPSYGKVNLSNMVSGILPVNNGGTGLTTFTVGELLYASSSSTISSISSASSTNALLSNGIGSPPIYGKINLTSMVSNVLPISNGGTGSSSLAAGVIYSNGTTLSSTPYGTASQVYRVNSAGTGFIFSKNFRIIQMVSTKTGAFIATGSIPIDNTIPQITEGTSILTLNITPKYSTSYLFVKYTTQTASGNNMAVALFRSPTANAVQSAYVFNIGIPSFNNAVFTSIQLSGTTSTITFVIRFGATTFANVNGRGTQIFNGTANTILTIFEII